MTTTIRRTVRALLILLAATVANAGSDITITLPMTTYTWEKTSDIVYVLNTANRHYDIVFGNDPDGVPAVSITAQDTPRALSFFVSMTGEVDATDGDRWLGCQYCEVWGPPMYLIWELQEKYLDGLPPCIAHAVARQVPIIWKSSALRWPIEKRRFKFE